MIWIHLTRTFSEIVPISAFNLMMYAPVLKLNILIRLQMFLNVDNTP